MTIPATKTELPALDSDYPLSAAQIAEYQTNGHILLRAVVSPQEIRPYRELITGATNEFAKIYPSLEQRDTYGKAFIQFENLWQKHPEVAVFTLARRFAKIVAELMGVNGVRIYHDQALYKEPGGGYTPWHQDQSYWPLDGAKAGTLWMPLVDVTAEMGTMHFASGSHFLGYLGEIIISDESEAQLERLIKENRYPFAQAENMSAGDCTFHNGWTIHGAPGNTSQERTREVMTIIYVEDGAVITEPDSSLRQSDLRSWFPGLKPGDLAATSLNPLVYHISESEEK